MNKLLKVIAFNFITALALLLFSPALDVNAAENTVWHVDSKNITLYYRAPGSAGSTAINVNTDITAYSQSFDLSALTNTSGQLKVEYAPFNCTYELNVQRYGSTANINRGGGYAENLNPCLYDDLGNTYLLDADGGSFMIEDISNITTLKFGYTGRIDYTVTYNPSTYKVGSYTFYSTNTAFDITLSSARTIIDLEGTVWTVPEGVENPVVIKCNETQKYLVDGVTGLCCFESPLDAGKYVLGAKEYIDVTVYDGDIWEHKALLREDYAETLGIQPVYCTNLFWFTEFLYSSLPEMTVTPLNPVPSESPAPTVPPDQIQPLDLGTVVINAPDGNGNYVDEGSVTVPAIPLYYQTKNAVANFLDDSKLIGATIEDYCAQIIGFFNITTSVDGYVSMSFPALHIDLNNLEYVQAIGSTSPVANLQHEDLEAIIILYANGEKYYISPYGGNVRIPVNSGKNRITFELGLQVKDDFTTKQGHSFRVKYEGNLDSFDVNIRTYKDQAATDLEKIKDLLENSDKADDLGNAGDSLGSIFGDYDAIENEGLGNAMGSIDSFDIDNAFNFGGGLLSALQFWLPVMTNIISGMGDFAVLYTIGMTLSFLAIVVGAVRFAISQSSANGKNYKNSKGSKGKKGGG